MNLALLLKSLLVSNTDAMGAWQIAAFTGVAFLLASVLGWIYLVTERPSAQASAVAAALVLAAPLMALLTAVIGHNLGVAVGLTGAFAAVRFRAPANSPMDLVFFVWAITVGMACGKGFFGMALLAVAVCASLLLVLRVLPFDQTNVTGWLSIAMTTFDRDALRQVERTLQKHLRAVTLAQSQVERAGQGCALFFKVKGATDDPKMLTALRCIAGVKEVASVTGLPQNLPTPCQVT